MPLRWQHKCPAKLLARVSRGSSPACHEVSLSRPTFFVGERSKATSCPRVSKRPISGFLVSSARYLKEYIVCIYGISLLNAVCVTKVLERIHKVDSLDRNLVSKSGTLAVYDCQCVSVLQHSHHRERRITTYRRHRAKRDRLEHHAFRLRR